MSNGSKMELHELLRPETDTPVLLGLVKERGIEAARLVAGRLDASQAGFWDALPTLIREWGGDGEVRSELVHSITWIWGAYGDARETLTPRLAKLEALFQHPEPLVRELVREPHAALLARLKAGDF